MKGLYRLPLSSSGIKESKGIKGNNVFTGNFEKHHMGLFPTKSKTCVVTRAL